MIEIMAPMIIVLLIVLIFNNVRESSVDNNDHFYYHHLHYFCDAHTFILFQYNLILSNKNAHAYSMLKY